MNGIETPFMPSVIENSTSRSIYPDCIPYGSAAILEQNLAEMIKQRPTFPAVYANTWDPRFLEIKRDGPEKAATMFAELQQSQPLYLSLSESDIEANDLPDLSEAKLEEIYRDYFTQVSGDVMPLSATHANLFPELKSAVKVGKINPREIAIATIDAHTDLDSFRLTGNEPLSKANVNARLLQNLGIGRLSLIGVPPDEQRYIKEGKPKYSTGADLDDKYRVMKKLFMDPSPRQVLFSKMIFAPDVRVEQAGIKRELDNMLTNFHDNGIKYLTFANDIDGHNTYREKIAATEYSTFSLLAGLAIQHLNKNGLAQLSKYYNYNDYLMRSSQCVANTISGAEHFNDQFFYDARAYGLKVQESAFILQYLQANSAEYGIEFGIPLPNGGRYIGGMFELLLKAPDLRKATANMVVNTITALSAGAA